ncbi:putative reverse transcriptase domain-containing protein, partial [Tanacetum coccineum]
PFALVKGIRLGSVLGLLYKYIPRHEPVGRSTTAPRGGVTGGQVGRGAKRTKSAVRRNNETIGELNGQGNDRGVKENRGVGGVPDFSTIIAPQFQNLLPTLLAQVGSRDSNQGNGGNQNGDAANDNIQGDVRNVIDMSGCEDNQKVKYIAGSFVSKALTWWNSQIHTRSREAAVGMSWEDFKNLTREEFCLINEMQKLETEFWNHVMVRAGHGAYTDRFHELARLVPYLVTPENHRIERYIYGLASQIHGMEAIRNGSLKKNTEKRGNSREPSRDRNVKDDNKRSRTGDDFATTANPVRREYTGGGRPNQVLSIDRGQGHGNNGNRACGGAFMLGAKEARQDPNIMTGTFTLNNHYAITLFDYGADYSFVSTAFIPLLGIESGNSGFSYEIEIASGQLVEIDKVIRGCELEIEGHTFIIDVIPFGSGSFDVIVGMDWLSKHKAEIICHERVVRIQLRNGKTLRVIGEKPEEKVRHIRSVKAKEQKKEDIVMVRNFPDVFLDDLSGLPPNREIKFRIDLIPGAIPVAKSPYRLAPSEMEELSGQLKELHDNGFIRPRLSP